jgi:hypothetical protein
VSGFELTACAVLAAFAAEWIAARRALRGRERLAEAWLAAGARPREVLARVRPRFRPALLVAAAAVVDALISPRVALSAAFAAAVAAIVAAGFAASALVTLRTFVDARLVDRPPPEARSPFRLKPVAPPASLEIYETRPPDDRAGHPLS